MNLLHMKRIFTTPTKIWSRLNQNRPEEQTSKYKVNKSSTKVSLNDEYLVGRGEQKSQKNRIKAKRQRKKMKKRENQIETAKDKLGEIIKGIYNAQIQFQQKQQQIEECLKHLKGGEKFHSFLNQEIHQQVERIRDRIWDFVYQSQLNEDMSLQLKVIDKIFEEYVKLSETSREIQEVINLFMRISGTQHFYEEGAHYLGKNTFNYIIDSEKNLKLLIRDCSQKISEKHTQQRQKLCFILSMISPLYEIYDEDQQILEKSTSIDEEDHEEFSTVKSKKKKRKSREIDYSSEFLDVVHKLNQMVITEKERKQCNIDNEWIKSLANRVNSFE